MQTAKNVSENSRMTADPRRVGFGLLAPSKTARENWIPCTGRTRDLLRSAIVFRFMSIVFRLIWSSIWRKRPAAALPSLRALSILLLTFVISPSRTYAQAPAPHQLLAELSRLSARKPFLTDSPDVYLEPKSLGRFFTAPIYKKLRGNAYFGYEYDEGFTLQGNVVQIEVLKDLTPGRVCQAAYPLALQNALKAARIEVAKTAPHQIGVCIVGFEPRETPQTLPGVMVEAYFRNSALKKSFFIRYGAGHRGGLPHAIRLSAEMLVAQLVSRTANNDNAQR